MFEHILDYYDYIIQGLTYPKMRHDARKYAIDKFRFTEYDMYPDYDYWTTTITQQKKED